MTALEDRLAAREKSLRGDLDSRLAAREAELAKTEGPGIAFFDEVGRSFMNNLLQLPKLPGNALAGAAAGIEGLGSMATGGDFEFGRRFEEEKEKFPASFINSLATTTQEVEAGATALRKEFPRGPVDGTSVVGRMGPSFDEELARINAEEAQGRERFPKSRAAGDVGGDVLTLVTGRLPFAKGINAAESALVAKKFTDSMTQPGTRRLFEAVLDSKVVRSLARGAGRTLETGAEAAVLSILQDGDPIETAAYAAGGQAVGSGILGSIKGVGKHPILASAFGMAALIQLSKETAPGGRDSFVDSLETGFEKVWWGLMMGATAAVAGAGRGRGGALSESWPKFTDALATIPRATSISLLEGYLNSSPEEQQTVDATLDQLQRDPEFFGPEITDKLFKAMQDGNLTEALRGQTK